MFLRRLKPTSKVVLHFKVALHYKVVLLPPL